MMKQASTSSQVKESLNSMINLDEQDRWKIHLLKNYLTQRQELREQLEHTQEIDILINALYST